METELEFWTILRVKITNSKVFDANGIVSYNKFGIILFWLFGANIFYTCSWGLEALLNFQTMVLDLTQMELANASLLDEATAASECMIMFYNSRSRAEVKAGKNDFFIPIKNRFIDHIELRIFNQWGILVFETEDKNINWSGLNCDASWLYSALGIFAACIIHSATYGGRISWIFLSFQIPPGMEYRPQCINMPNLASLNHFWVFCLD